MQVWIVHHLQIIGEATARVSDALQDRHWEVPWPQIIAMRNILVHEYFGVDTEEVWDTVECDVPELKCKIETILASLEGTS